jgi:hypothetical protein
MRGRYGGFPDMTLTPCQITKTVFITSGVLMHRKKRNRQRQAMGKMQVC